MDADPKPIQKITFSEKLARAQGATLLLIIEEAKKKHIIYFRGNSNSILNLFSFNMISDKNDSI